MRSRLALVVLATAVLGCREAMRPERVSAISLEPCRLEAPSMPIRVEAECGRIEVPEDRTKPEGRKIALRVAVVPGTQRPVKPDPLFWITGGPGQAATEAFVEVASAFSLFDDRDFVLVDQRGTGGSNALVCEAPDALGAFPGEGAIAAWLAECRATLDADLAQYTTAHAVRDLEDVRLALGYGEINLYGVSYGSRVALEYLARHEAHVRSVILDGVVPRDVALGDEVGQNAQHALDLVLDRCDQDDHCAARFPHARRQVAELFSRLEGAPAELDVPHPSTSSVTHIRLGPGELSRAIRLFIYQPETAALLPLLVDRAVTEGRLEPLAAQAILLEDALQTRLASAMNLTVICAEDAPFFGAEAPAPSNAPLWAANPERDEVSKSCARWIRADLAGDFRTPVVSERPVLLLSGEADPVTPPTYAAHVAKTLQNSRHLVAPEMGHMVITRRCPGGLAAQFLDRASVAFLEAGCLERMRAPPFFVDALGPTP